MLTQSKEPARASLPGPSRRITVEPIEVPAGPPLPRETPAPDREPEREPVPSREEPVPTP
jgi:hypothetical protein